MQRLVLFVSALLVTTFSYISAASAVTELTLAGTPIFHQTENSPCVFGNPSCSNPAGFDFTLIPVADAGDLWSGLYDVSDITGLVGPVFYMGIDLQQAQLTYELDNFEMYVNSVLIARYSGGPVTLSNHGNGYSDMVLSGFDLSSFLGTDDLQFHLGFSQADAAREQFFVAASAAVPEPASMLLLGAGLIAGVAQRRRLMRL